MGAAWLTAVMLIAGSSPNAVTVGDFVDLIEVNHYHDETGKPIFRQLIFYDFDPEVGRFQVRAWRLIKSETQLPVRTWANDRYVVSWQDGEVMRVVRASDCVRTWTQSDPELAERRYLPREQRVDFRQPIGKNK